MSPSNGRKFEKGIEVYTKSFSTGLADKRRVYKIRSIGPKRAIIDKLPVETTWKQRGITLYASGYNYNWDSIFEYADTNNWDASEN